MKRFNVLCLLALIALETEARVPLGVNQYRDSDQRQPSVLQLEKKKHRMECDDLEFRASLLSMIKEMPFIGLFADIKGQTKFEASGMTTGPDPSGKNWLWIVFDNLFSLGRVDEHFEFRDKHNLLVGETGEDSQFEGITYAASTGHFFAIEEIYIDEEHGLEPYAHELEISQDGSTYTTVQRCPVHYQFQHENKGFEGLHYHEDAHGHKYLMGLCEGNYCSGGSEGRVPGHGRLIVSEFNGKSGEDCGWDVIKVVHLPKTAYFVDYSDLDFRDNKAAVVSQENSAMWVATFDFEALEFTSEGTVYHFPRDNHCDMLYCNVEGVQFLDDVRIVISSDKAKKDQPYRCIEKEQRISIFALPEGAEATPPPGKQHLKDSQEEEQLKLAASVQAVE